MQTPPRNRMASPETRDKPAPIAAEIVPVSDPPTTVRCPHCGAARMHQWDKYGGGSEPYKMCRSCGTKWAFFQNGTMRQIG